MTRIILKTSIAALIVVCSFPAITMADQILKDRYGSQIGSISTSSSGVQTIKDKYGSSRGMYDPKSNTTKDRYGSTIGSGNLLPALLDVALSDNDRC